MWENHVISLLMVEEARALSLTPLVNDAQPITFDIPFKDSCKHGNENSLAEEIDHFFGSGKLEDSILLIPGRKNQTTFDALSILKSGTITIFQTTIGGSHFIIASGLDFIWDAIQKSKHIGTLKPSRLNKWRLVFCTPQRVKDEWKKPQGIDYQKKVRKHNWDKMIDQYLVAFEDVPPPKRRRFEA